LGGSNNRAFWEADTSAKFDVTVALTGKDPRLRPGLTAQIVIHGEPRKDVLYLPRLAVMSKDSKQVVYVKKGSSFEPRELKILARNESRAAVEGVAAGTEVAMIDPTAPRKTSSNTEPSAGGQP
jgi:hypothetical protein